MVIGVGTAGVELAFLVPCLIQRLVANTDTDVGIRCTGFWPVVVNGGPSGSVAEDANHSRIAISQQPLAHLNDVVRMNDAERHGALPRQNKRKASNLLCPRHSQRDIQSLLAPNPTPDIVNSNAPYKARTTRNIARIKTDQTLECHEAKKWGCAERQKWRTRF